MACSLLRLGTHWAWFIFWLKTISPHQVHITLHCYFESCLKGQRKRDVDYMHSLQWQHIPVSSQNLRSLEENSHSLFCSMVLKYESQHLPYKSTSYVGKYTIHGAYGTVPSTSLNDSNSKQFAWANQRLTSRNWAPLGDKLQPPAEATSVFFVYLWWPRLSKQW